MRLSALACLATLALSAFIASRHSDALQLPPAAVPFDPNNYGNAGHLRHFPTSELPGAYLLSYRDEYHFAVPYASNAVRFAAYATWKKFGRALRPMEVWDCSMSDGDTPTGRHPGNAHDGGINFDITYFMKVASQEKIVCPETADSHCVGPALRMDEQRQAYFYASLAQLDLEMDEELIQLMACDGWVKQGVLPVLDRFAADGTFSTTVVNHTKRLLEGSMVDDGRGWYRFHHDHTHLRFRWQPTVAAQMASAISARASGVRDGRGLLAVVPPAPPAPAAPKPEPPAPMIAVAPPAPAVPAPVRVEEPPVVAKPPVPSVPLIALVTPPAPKPAASALPTGKKPTTTRTASKATKPKSSTTSVRKPAARKVTLASRSRTPSRRVPTRRTTTVRRTSTTSKSRYVKPR